MHSGPLPAVSGWRWVTPRTSHQPSIHTQAQFRVAKCSCSGTAGESWRSSGTTRLLTGMPRLGNWTSNLLLISAQLSCTKLFFPSSIPASHGLTWLTTHLCDFFQSAPLGPAPQSYAWMMKVYSFWLSQSTGLLAFNTPSPDVRFSTTASNGASCP